MSYSFQVKAANKAAAKEAVAAEVVKVLGYQPIHERDRAAILANANSVIDLLADDDGKDVSVSCNGYLTWSGAGTFDPATAVVNSANVTCYASNVARVEIKTYADGTTATGTAPLPDQSPAEQDAAK